MVIPKRFSICLLVISMIQFINVDVYSQSQSEQDEEYENIILALPRWMGSLTGSVAFPQKPIKQHIDKTDWGWTVDMMYRIQYNKPFLAGLSFSEQWISGKTNKYREVYGGIELDLKERATTRRLEVMAVVGFYPETNTFIQPYILGRAGWGMFRTASVIFDDDDQEELERIKEFTDNTFGYGLDIGAHFVPTIWYIRFDLRLGFRSNVSSGFMAYDEDVHSGSNYPINDFKFYTSAANWLTASIGTTVMF